MHPISKISVETISSQCAHSGVINPLARSNSVLINLPLLGDYVRHLDPRKKGEDVREIQRGAITIIMSRSLYELMLLRYFAFLRERARAAPNAGAVSLWIYDRNYTSRNGIECYFHRTTSLQVDSAAELFNENATSQTGTTDIKTIRLDKVNRTVLEHCNLHWN